MLTTRERLHRLIDELESRQLLANPGIVDFTVSAPVVHAGDVITLTAHAADDTGVRAVVFWIEDEQDGLHQFIANSYDQPLGDVFTPDSGTTDRYSAQVRVGASWKSTVKFGVDVVDVDGNYSQTPINFVTIQNLNKPFVLGMRAETLGNGDIHLIATASADGEHVTSTGIAGVTFFLDQNGNGQWDVGTDVDLGLGTNVGGGSYELTVTPQGGWNTTWFAASAFDTRSSGDRFGPNHTTVLRGDASPPLISQFDIIPPDFDTHAAVFSSDETVRFYAEFTAASGTLGATMFMDRNQNGLFDVGIDTPLKQHFVAGSPTTGWFDLFQPLGALGHGWQSVGIAVHDASGRGNDSWSAVTTLWINIDNTPWITNANLSQTSISQGTGSVDLTFRVHDDDGVMGIVRAKMTHYFSGGGFGDVGFDGSNLVQLTPGRTNAIWRLTFDTHSLVPGNYSVDIWLQDYRDIRGPRTVIPFTIV